MRVQTRTQFLNKYLLILLILIAVTPTYSQNNQDKFDAISYRLNIEFFPATERLQGVVAMTAKNIAAGNMDEVTLNLIDNMQVDSVYGNGTAFSHNNNLLTIALDRQYQTGELFEVIIAYQGQPAQDKAFSPVVFSHRRGRIQTETISTESCPYYARYWWPCKDTPADKPDSVHLFITVPEMLDVAANGILSAIQQHENGTRTHHWHIKNPIATYLITMQIADYAQFSDTYTTGTGELMPLMFYIFPEDSAKAYSYFMRTADMIGILASYFGEYPYLNEKYGLAEYIGEWAAMEYQTLSCFTQAYITDSLTIVHELTHQWFGDCVTPASFHHSWISEGFAVLSEAIYEGHFHGEDAYHNYMNSENNAHNYHVPVYRCDISTPYKVYHGVVYNKGAWVLHMLRHIVGDTLFFQTLREYLDRFKYQSATTEDLQHVFEDVCALDLEYFFHQWIYESWYPEYVYGWAAEELENGQFQLTGFIDQKQTEGPEIFKMPLDITVQFENGDTTFVLMVDEQGEPLNLTLNRQPTNLVLDPDDWVLKSALRSETPKVEYLNYLINDDTANKNQRPDPGETVQLFINLLNTQMPATAIQAVLSTEDPDISIQTNTVNYGTLPHRVITDNKEQPFEFSVAAEATGHLCAFNLIITGANDYKTTLTFGIKIGKARTLYVDDDAGDEYETFIEPVLEEAGIYSETWDLHTKGSAGIVFENYDTIIWLTGDSRDSTITEPEQQALTDFLARGGHLLLSGQNIAFDLGERGSSQDSVFLTDVLHAAYCGDSSGAMAVMSVSGNPVAPGMQIFFDIGPGGAKNQTSMDNILPLDPAQSFINYIPGNTSAGIYYFDEMTQARLIFLPFGIEGISGPVANSASTFLTRMMEWLGGTSAVTEWEVFEALPEFFDLSQNYPNPFNPATFIEYQVPEASHVRLEIFNLLGQKVRTLVNTRKNAGFFRTEWDGSADNGEQVASGIYLMHFKAGHFKEIKKMMIVR